MMKNILKVLNRLSAMMVVLFLVVHLGLSVAHGSTLFLGQVGGALRTVNESTGGTTFVGSYGTGSSAGGLSARPGDTSFVYGLHSTSGSSSNSRLLKIDVTTGSATPSSFFNEATLGFTEPFSTAVAISSLDPNVAIVAGFDSTTGPTFGDDYIWKVNVNTGAVLGAGVASTALEALTFSLDGTTLYGTEGGVLVTVNPATGSTTTVGDPGLSSFIEGLAFRPGDGVLFAIDAFFTDNLVTLNPLTGALVSTVGSLGIADPDGLAFVVPEPSSFALLATSVCILGNRRRRKK